MSDLSRSLTPAPRYKEIDFETLCDYAERGRPDEYPVYEFNAGRKQVMEREPYG